MMKSQVKAYEVYWLKIHNDPNATHRQKGNRPVIIMQCNELNDSNILTTIIIPTTSKERADNEYECEIKHTVMPQKSVALCDNIQLVDDYRIKKSDYITTLDERDVAEIKRCLMNVLALK